MSLALNETGTVVRHEGAEVVLRMDAGGHADRCASCGACCGGGEGREHLLYAKESWDSRLRDVNPGDRVELSLRLPGQAFSAAMLFGLPLVCMAVLAVVAHIMTNGQSEGAVFGALGAGFFLGLGGVALANRLLKLGGLGIQVLSITPGKSDSQTKQHQD